VPFQQPQKTHHDGRFYELRIRCPEKYPAVPPEVRFVSKINMTCVDPRTGVVNLNKVQALQRWDRNMGIEQVLGSLRAEMCSKQNLRLGQAAEGATF
jgi:DNA topoisomerase-2/ubiquitin-conjugating enzyme E2 variant